MRRVEETGILGIVRREPESNPPKLKKFGQITPLNQLQAASINNSTSFSKNFKSLCYSLRFKVKFPQKCFRFPIIFFVVLTKKYF